MLSAVAFDDRRIDWATRPVPPSTTWLRQVHGATTLVVAAAGEHTGATADALVTSCPGAELLIRTADCAPVALVGRHGDDVVGVGAVHAGWRGLRAGVVASAVGALRQLGASRIEATLGPCIGPECYEFGVHDLAAMAELFGDAVLGRTASGAPALDLPGAVRSALRRESIPLDESAWSCTACDRDRCFSHRARRESGRLGLRVALIDPDRDSDLDPGTDRKGVR